MLYRKIALLIMLFFLASCGEEKSSPPLKIEKPCPDVNAFADKLKRFFKDEHVLVAGLKSKGNLCAYTVFLGEKAAPVSFYYVNNVIIMGVGYEEVGDSFEPFYASAGLGQGEEEGSLNKERK